MFSGFLVKDWVKQESNIYHMWKMGFHWVGGLNWLEEA
jgi:hypothetical protein